MSSRSGTSPWFKSHLHGYLPYAQPTRAPPLQYRDTLQKDSPEDTQETRRVEVRGMESGPKQPEDRGHGPTRERRVLTPPTASCTPEPRIS